MVKAPGKTDFPGLLPIYMCKCVQQVQQKLRFEGASLLYETNSVYPINL